MSALSRTLKRVQPLLLLANLLLVAALLVFSKGFFPTKSFIAGHNVFDSEALQARPSPPFERVILMVVDALRSDFVYDEGSGFQFTQSLIRSGDALPFTAHADPPTVTMPRIKAITTGSVPSFLDVILNFAEGDSSSSLIDQDTWLGQMQKSLNANLTLFGDDTWLKLFPGLFMRHDGTSSFFVSDFTEVDNNVTRHVTTELDQSDWQVMILHYLGLDHIGHKQGPQSSNMVPKQQEMDSIVTEIFEAISTNPAHDSTLFVLCGDHGMNEGGNHGGASAGETSPALVLISPKLRSITNGLPSPISAHEDFTYHQRIQQSDLCPTLAGLLGFPIPLNNLGVFIPPLLKLWKNVEDQNYLLVENAKQILDLATGSGSSNTRTTKNTESSGSLIDEQLKCLHSMVADREVVVGDSNRNTEAMLSCLKSSQERLSRAASTYQTRYLWLGVASAALALALTLLHLQFMGSSMGCSPLCLTFLSIVCISFASSMFATSFVEEEQQVWYWIAPIWMWFVCVASLRHFKPRRTKFLAILIVLGANRALQRWKQTGQKHAGNTDVQMIITMYSPMILWVLVSTTYIQVGLSLWRSSTVPGRRGTVSKIVAVSLTIISVLFKFSFTLADAPELTFGLDKSLPRLLQNSVLILLARSIFVLLILGLIVEYSNITKRSISSESPSSLLDYLTFFLTTQSRVANVPTFGLFSLVRYCLGTLGLTRHEHVMSCLLLARTSYFALGGSNAVSSVDLSNAYNGVSNFNVVVVGILLFASNWAGPIWWAYSLLNPPGKKYEPQEISVDPLGYTTLVESVGLLAVLLACTLLRDHLFIWTVFSPKFLVAAAWTGYHVIFNLVGDVVGGVLT